MRCYPLVRKLLFLLGAEQSHTFSLEVLKLLAKFKKPYILKKQVDCLGLTFPNPIGLAAGFDKNGDYIDALALLGFGFIEVGTVTPRPQIGNLKPRLFRLPQIQGLINRMGFNNKGVDYLVEKLKSRRYLGIIGVNIGKNFDTPIEQAVTDYLICFKKVALFADYVTVNISSPNTQNLRQLQSKNNLKNLLIQLKEGQAIFKQKSGKYVPLLIKIAPDLSNEEVLDIAETVNLFQLDGVIATNTSISKENLPDMRYKGEAGGLSGFPIQSLSNKIGQELKQQLKEEIPIIKVGGIVSSEEAVKQLTKYPLIQVYTGLIYQGPLFVKSIFKAINYNNNELI